MFFTVYYTQQQDSDYCLFKWHWEPGKRAFKIPLSRNWISKGRIFRIDPNTGGSAANAPEAKPDFMINNKNATASTRWYPDLYCFDLNQELELCHYEFQYSSLKENKI